MSSELSGSGLSDKDKEKQKRELLLKVYGSAVDEYRFNVNLGWDQTKFYVTAASAAIAAGVGLLRLALESVLISFFMILYFALPGFIALLGLKTADVRKKYIREANLKKSLVELELELELYKDIIPEIPGTNLGIAVTPGQKDSIAALVNRKKRAIAPVRRGTVVHFTQLLFYGLVAVSVIGSVLSYVNVVLLYNSADLPQKERHR